MTAEQSLSLCARITAVSVLISSLEMLVNRKILRDEGLMSWKIGRLRVRGFAVGPFARFWDFVAGYPNIAVVHAVAVIVAASMAVGTQAWSLSPIPALLLWATLIVGTMRTNYGHDGADQLAAMILLSLSVSGLVPTDLSRIACLGFLAFQACLAYGTAGWAKAPMPGWRDGSYLTAILRTHIYGSPAVGEILAVHPRLARAATLAVLAWECTFPLVLILPAPAAWAMLAMGVFFHLTNAFVMRLNTFVWSFLATYPAVIWIVLHRGF